jgi:hypothetical protein
VVLRAATVPVDVERDVLRKRRRTGGQESRRRGEQEKRINGLTD